MNTFRTLAMVTIGLLGLPFALVGVLVNVTSGIVLGGFRTGTRWGKRFLYWAVED